MAPRSSFYEGFDVETGELCDVQVKREILQGLELLQVPPAVQTVLPGQLGQIARIDG
jgi:hypothetical protein